MFKNILYLLIFLVLDSQASDQEVIIWLSDDENYVENFRQTKPANIDSDTNNLLLARIKHFQIKLQYTPLGRIEKLMETGDNYCIANRLKNKSRQKRNIFSLPLNLFLGLRVYSSKQVPNQFINEQGELPTLNHLFEDVQNKVLLISRGRSYGDLLDQQIANIDKEKLYVLSGQSYIEAAFYMLSRGRVDYIIEYPAEITQMLKKNSKSLTLSAISIANTDEYVIGYLACNKTAIGQRFITSVNEILKELHQTDAFFQAHTQHLNKADIALFKHYFNDLFSTKH